MDEVFQWAHFLSNLQLVPRYDFSLTYKICVRVGYTFVSHHQIHVTLSCFENISNIFFSCLIKILNFQKTFFSNLFQIFLSLSSQWTSLGLEQMWKIPFGIHLLMCKKKQGMHNGKCHTLYYDFCICEGYDYSAFKTREGKWLFTLLDGNNIQGIIICKSLSSNLV